MKKRILAFLTAAMCFAGVMPVNAIAEDSVKGLNGLQEAGGSLITGEQSDGVFVDYYYKLGDISETAETDTAKLIIDKDYSSDTVKSSCTVKSLSKDLTIDAGDNDIIVLLDEAELEKTITVKADKGSVTFFIQGSLTCGKESKGIVWHDICDGCKINDTKYIPITFYGSEDSVVTLNDEAVLCGSLRLPYTVLDDRSSGAFEIEYAPEADNKTYSIKPSVIGNVLVKKLMNAEVVFAYCSGKDKTGNVYAEPEYKIVKLPDKVEYKLGEQIDLKGIEIEVTNDKKEPVAYTYPDVAFDYQSNIPKAPRVILHSDFRSDKAGTYKVEIVGADNVSFEVKVIDDEEITTGTIKATVLDINEKSLLLQSISNCYERYLLFTEQIKGDITPTVGMSLEITYESGMFNLVPILLIGNVKKVSVVSEKTEFLKGDANCDGQVDMADVVFIMQALANPDRYGEKAKEYQGITALGKLNGDMNGDGLTVNDALAIQKKLLGIEENEAPVIKLNTVIPLDGSDYVELKPYESMTSSYDPVLSSLNGIGVWFDFQSEKYPITLTADKGTFKTYTYKSGGIGTVDEVGSTYEVGKSGSVSWVPDDISIPIGYEAKIKITGDDNGNSVDLGTLVINKNPKSDEGVVFVTLQKPNTSASSNPLPHLSDIVSIKTPYRPAMSDWSGIGILLEFDSKDYPINLSTDKGHFTSWDIETGDGVVTNVGKTYDIGNSGYIFWTPDDLKYSDDYENEITVKCKDGDRQVELGNIYVTMADNGDLTASLEKSSIGSSVIAGKTFVYEKDGFGSEFEITFNADQTYSYYEGVLSSYIGSGTWKITDDTVVMIENTSKKVNYLKIQGSDLVYIANDSDNFYYIKVKDGEKFSVQTSAE